MTKTRRAGFRKKRRRGGRKTVKRRGGRKTVKRRGGRKTVKRRGGKRSRRRRGGRYYAPRNVAANKKANLNAQWLKPGERDMIPAVSGKGYFGFSNDDGTNLEMQNFWGDMAQAGLGSGKWQGSPPASAINKMRKWGWGKEMNAYSRGPDSPKFVYKNSKGAVQ